MKPEQITRLRKAQGWTRKELASLLTGSLDRAVSETTLGRYEKGERQIPEEVNRFLDALALEGGLPPEPDLPSEQAFDEGLGSDAPPAEPFGAGKPTPPLMHRTGAYVNACTELFEVLATAVGTVGALAGSQVLVADGQILAEDKQALGQAWGKLAETNETLRGWLVAASTSGAWFEVALASGLTAGRLLRNHQQFREARETAAQQQFEQPPQVDEATVEYAVG